MDFRKLDKLIDSLPACGIPMCDLAVTYKGEHVYRHSLGYSAPSLQSPRRQTIYTRYSQTQK